MGSGPDLGNYQEYIKKYKLEKKVIFTGAVPWENIQDYYMVADVFTTASHTETQGLTVVEAMAASLPVVCVSDESFQDTVIDGLNGLVFNNRREYKRCMISLYKDRELLGKLAKQARITSGVHSARYFAEKVLDVYRIAINNYNKERIPLISKIKNVIKGDKDEK